MSEIKFHLLFSWEALVGAALSIEQMNCSSCLYLLSTWITNMHSLCRLMVHFNFNIWVHTRGQVCFKVLKFERFRNEKALVVLQLFQHLKRQQFTTFPPIKTLTHVHFQIQIPQLTNSLFLLSMKMPFSKTLYFSSFSLGGFFSFLL